jgi:hypothetical protein
MCGVLGEIVRRTIEPAAIGKALDVLHHGRRRCNKPRRRIDPAAKLAQF